jgi:tetratricopeptide (TPR) repeat protein
MGDTVNSVLWLDKLQKAKDCDKLEAKGHLADIHFLKGNNVKANTCYMEALNVMDVSTHLKYAEFLLLTNNHTYAIVIMKDALKHAKKDDSFYIEVCQRTAELYWSIKLYVSKLSSITRNIYEKKANKFANMALEAINKLYGSIEAYYEYPCNRTKRLANLASIYLSMGDEATAEKYIQMGLKCNLCANCVYMKCVDIYEIYGLLYEARDEYDKAIECYEMIAGQDLGVMVYLKRLSNVRTKRF